MIGESRLEAMPIEILRLMTQIQDWTIQDIARRVRKTGVITSSAEYQMTRLAELVEADEQLKALIQKQLKLSDVQVKKLFTEAAKAEYIYDKRLFKAKGLPFIPFEDNAFMQSLTQNIIQQTNEELINITQSLGFAEKVNDTLQFKPIAKVYQNTLDFANLQVATGVTDISTAIKGAVDKLAKSGLRTVDYASGWSNRIDVATRRAIMGGMRDLANRKSEQNAAEIGTTCFEISWHSGHRPSHGWGGRRYDTTGEEYPLPAVLFEKYGGGTPEDYNCYHEVYAVFPDTPPSYTDKELDEMEREEKVKKAYGDKSYTRYEAKQQQRDMEFKMRIQRSKIKGYEADGLEEDATWAKIKYQDQLREYRAFNKAMGLPNEYERIYQDGLGKLGNSGFTKKTNDDIILPKVSKVADEVLKDTVDLKELDGIIPIGARLEDVTVISGKNVATNIRDIARLEKTYGGGRANWQKKAGVVKSNHFSYEVHWYSNSGVSVEPKFKRGKQL
ncbi:MAG: phage minor capsid protein [Clostridiales bacterium]|jgi:hypothetical protein|nr:phage minor capsid protein [Clostridiales bacterium]